jgi:predicted lysophospholipase L1 biosynthesis ABC-type transport system permease subunit
MKSEQEYIRDLSEIRSMMERSTRFLSLTGWSGIMAGVYALAGAYIAYRSFYQKFGAEVFDSGKFIVNEHILDLVLLAVAVLVLAIGTAIFLSQRKSIKTGERLWNAAARRLIINMAIPLVTGGIFILILLSKSLFVFAAPSSLIFYGLALLNASKFTFEELRSLGIIQVVLGLLAAFFIDHAILFWALGFGCMHIIYGIYMHLKYEK